jgi:hypothetical protein
MIEPDGYEHTIFFSRTTGEHAIYQVSDMLHLDH